VQPFQGLCAGRSVGAVCRQIDVTLTARQDNFRAVEEGQRFRVEEQVGFFVGVNCKVGIEQVENIGPVVNPVAFAKLGADVLFGLSQDVFEKFFRRLAQSALQGGGQQFAGGEGRSKYFFKRRCGCST
jgi:hypothetical protein